MTATPSFLTACRLAAALWLAASGAASAQTAAAAAAAAAAPAPATTRSVPDTIGQRVLACTTCHGKEGRATADGYFPRIAGKPAGYLYNQLVNFREGRRSNATMTYLVEHLSDTYLREIAGYFSAQDLPYPPPQTQNLAQEVAARGQALSLHGDAKRGIPACTQCHGTALTGVAPAVPGLLGLPRDYLIGQFGAWKTGERKARAPDCMAQIAARLSAEDIGTMASWLSAQPVPANAKPSAAPTLPLPMPCGSGLE